MAKTAKSAKPKPRRVVNSSKRKLDQPKYRSFRLSKTIKQPKPPIRGGFRLFGETLQLLWQRKKLFLGLVTLAFLLNTILVKGVTSGGQLSDIKELLDGALTGTAGSLTIGITLFSVLVGGANNTLSETAVLYQAFVTVVCSLAAIWAIRHAFVADAHIHIRLRDAFYKGMYPLVPFLFVLIVMGLQLIPLAIANFLYSTVIVGGLAVTLLEKVLWILFIGLLAILSFYMLSSSVFALYIVTLADMEPMQALRSARELVRHRRWSIIRKLLVLPFCLLLIGAVIVIPLIMVSPTAAEWLFYWLSMLALVTMHAYLYNLYRKLL